MPTELTPVASEFQSLPLEYLVSAPLTAAVQAQAVAAVTTQKFLNDLKGQTVDFESQITNGEQVEKRTIKAPLLACVPVPHLRIDSLTTHFKFEISQINQAKSITNSDIGGSLKSSSLLSSMLGLSIEGKLTHESSRETTTNRSGMMEVTIHASEAEMPAGLSKVLNWLTNSIPETKGT